VYTKGYPWGCQDKSQSEIKYKHEYA